MEAHQTPIYIQIAEWLENQIIEDELIADGKVYSQYQLAEIFNVNPATAGKGITCLLEDHLLYKKRGLGMFVQTDAKEKIMQKRRNQLLESKLEELVAEAKRLDVEKEQLIAMLHQLYKEDM
ncbi:MAG: GntR family transcriptional regulator [Kurthia sp.]|nr:GntR family transcriptional regulator [Candidatus Kurthia equi]